MIENNPVLAPRRVSDPAEAFALLRSSGAAILTGCGNSDAANISGDDARKMAENLLASLSPVIPDPALIKEGATVANRYYELMPGIDDHKAPFQSGHTDGFGYGDAYPDYVPPLLCARSAEIGGESFVVDTYRLLDALGRSTDEADRSFYTFLTTEPVQQTEPGYQASIAPVFLESGHGRRMARWTAVQRADESREGADRERQAAALARWRTMAFNASMGAPRFTLQPGEMLCVDNYRMLHGRTGFDDPERALWRIWAWTTEALRVPERMLYSDNRYARTN